MKYEENSGDFRCFLPHFLLCWLFAEKQSSAQAGGLAPEKLVSEFNHDKGAVFSDIGLTEGKNISLSNGVGAYQYSDRQNLFGKNFTLSLLFNQSSAKKELYAADYRLDFTGDSASKDSLAAARDLMKQLSQKYGNPTTYPASTARTLYLPEDWATRDGYYYEQWRYSHSATVYLNLESSAGACSVTVEYKSGSGEQVRTPKSSK